MSPIEIIFQDEHLIAVNKPIGLAVHKNKHMAHDAPYLTKLLGDQCGQWVYNVHRLDAKTSGIMVLAFSPEMAKLLTKQFENRTTSKSYQAIVKGIPGDGLFDQAVLDRKKGRRVAASTSYRTLASLTTDLSSKGVDNVPISLVELQPTTGRWHQLRQHCSQQRYDIIGDIQHGDWTLNRLIAERTTVGRLCLHAHRLIIDHPVSTKRISLEAPIPEAFEQVWQHWS